MFSVDDLIARVLWNFKVYYGVEPNEVEVTDVPGYWRMKEICGGRGKCTSPLHGFMLCELGIQHTLYFAEHARRDERGRFVSPFIAWKVWREVV